MKTVEVSRDLNADPDQVWALTSDLSRWDEWFSPHRSWKSDLPAEVGKGTVLVANATVMNAPATLTWTVEEWLPPQSVVISAAGIPGIKHSLETHLAPSPTGTTVTVRAHFGGPILVGPVAGVVQRGLTNDVNTSLDNLTRLLA